MLIISKGKKTNIVTHRNTIYLIHRKMGNRLRNFQMSFCMSEGYTSTLNQTSLLSSD